MPGRSRKISGIGASPGIAIGHVFLLDRRQVRVPRYHVEDDQVQYEVDRLRRAIAQSIEQLESIRSRFVGGGMDHHAILEAHEMMLGDEALVDEATQLIIDEQRNAEWAVNRVVSRIRGLFDSVSDSYLRDRRGDIDFVGDRILRNLVGQVADISDIGQLEDGTIVIAHDLSPVDTAVLTRHRITAFVTEMGGRTSHTSIIARSLGVPAVVGAHDIFEAVGSGDTIIVDGLAGSVTIRPSRRDLDNSRKRADAYDRLNLELLEAKALPARTLDGFEVAIAGNIELPSEVETVLARGGEAIGLYRTEFMYIGRRSPPSEEDHYRIYCQIFDEVGDRPVTVRTLDLGGDKIFPAMQTEVESNPALGKRAIRYCLDNPAIFEPQIAGLLRAGTRGDLRIMLPMISGVDELRAAKQVVSRVQKRLVEQGKDHRSDVPLGIMIEVPSAVMTADLLAKESDFFAIGTNDLMQYLLAIDRTNDRVAYLYDPLHPAVLRTLQRIVEASRDAKLPVSVCGEVAGDVEHVPVLLGFGLDALSMNSGSIPRIKRMIRELDQSDCQELLTAALRCTSRSEVHTLVKSFLAAKAPMTLESWPHPYDPNAYS